MEAELPTLYSFRRCPYAMRARMALLIAGVTSELREVKLSDKPDAMVTASPKATVPVLVTTEGIVVDESLAVMRWALGQRDPEAWLARCDDALIAANDGPFKHHLDRYKYSARHDTDPQDHRAAGFAHLRLLEERLSGQQQLSGDVRGFTDIALFPFVRQFAHTDRDWFAAQPIPRVQAWLTGHLASELFKRAMVKRAPWAEGDAPVLFPEAEAA
ncbi:glutathione S-transferase [Pacificimonas sp. WHA3]|uniref:Glutathione S-transferase n=1 Tax=Pacificimonas pallii TaxID=2827236 RepID=A0ABS6SCK1_9SPHN|nr:glutathione S-transferase [Pacificimonas pallii]MBV7255960.1 glutathione S-transferase [Pacificimonas pallii]